jgi:hypothetical protein
MKLTVFKEVVRLLQAQNIKDNSFSKLGLDTMNLNEDLDTAVVLLIGAAYGEKGKETFLWWCYDKDWGTREDLKMTDEDGTELCKTIEDLWQYLEDNISDDYDIPVKMTDEERLEFIETVFRFGG